MKEESTEYQFFFKKKTGISLLLDYIFSFIGFLLVLMFLASVFDIVRGILKDIHFNILWYMRNESPFVDFGIPHFIIIPLIFYAMWTRNRTIKKKPYISIMREKIVLKFGDKSIPWENVQEIETDGEKNLRIQFLSMGFAIRGVHAPRTKTKKQTIALERLVEKGKFFDIVKNICREKNIPFHEVKASI